MPSLRDLPSVDALLNTTELAALIDHHGVQAVRNELRALQVKVRANAVNGQAPEWVTSPADYAEQVTAALNTVRYQPVFNLTGTVLHTNLGRALLSPEQWRGIEPLVTRPMNLEYDLSAGARGKRDAIVEQRLIRLTGCEAATIVNNNAAALLLVLNTFALGKSVPVSRGELIEIGGSFRLPELMARSGCQLAEVGTTNRTHLRDFAAVANQAALLLKVHPSNYHIDGFTKSVDAAELAQLAKEHHIPSCVDLGAGTLVDLSHWGLPVEPTPQSVLDQGIDIVTFSGDKLLGSAQAGIIVGKREYVDQIKSNPLKRALRADKITMALLEATLKLYEDSERLPKALPLLHTLTLPEAELRARAERVADAFSGDWHTAIEQSSAQIGSGALPDKTIASVAVTLTHPSLSPQAIQDLLRAQSTPIIGRISDNRVWLDMRGAEPLEELLTLLAGLRP